MPLDLTWARERILKIIEALGRKAKLSIFCEFYSGRSLIGLTHTKLSVGVAIWVFDSFKRSLLGLTHYVAALQICRRATKSNAVELVS